MVSGSAAALIDKLGPPHERRVALARYLTARAEFTAYNRGAGRGSEIRRREGCPKGQDWRRRAPLSW
jgi:hypothetical protein